MKFIGSALIATALLMPACATVEIASGDSAPVVKVAELEDSVTLRRSAKTLAYTFSKNGWSQQSVSAKAQSAANILLRGMKGDKSPAPNPRKAYSESQTLEEVKADIVQAKAMVESIADKGYIFLSQNPDHIRVRRDLSALEKALAAARQAEMTFAAALEDKSGNATAVLDFTQSVDRLRTVTDAFGDRQRQNQSTIAAS